MPIPASRYPALKARKVLRLLGKVGYETERQRGSRRKLVAAGRQPIGFAFHHGVEATGDLPHMLVQQPA